MAGNGIQITGFVVDTNLIDTLYTNITSDRAILAGRVKNPLLIGDARLSFQEKFQVIDCIQEDEFGNRPAVSLMSFEYGCRGKEVCKLSQPNLEKIELVRLPEMAG